MESKYKHLNQLTKNEVGQMRRPRATKVENTEIECITADSPARKKFRSRAR